MDARFHLFFLPIIHSEIRRVVICVIIIRFLHEIFCTSTRILTTYTVANQSKAPHHDTHTTNLVHYFFLIFLHTCILPKQATSSLAPGSSLPYHHQQECWHQLLFWFTLQYLGTKGPDPTSGKPSWPSLTVLNVQ